MTDDAAAKSWPELPDPAMLETILDVIATEGKVDRALIVPGATLESLGLQSIDVVSILMELEERLEVYIPMSADLSAVRDLNEMISVIVREMQQDTLKDIGRKE
jgi:acyl carrier protein